MKIAITCRQLIRDLDGLRGALEEAGFALQVPEIEGQHLEGEALVEALQGCVGAVAGDDRFSAEVLARLPQLRVISKWGVGLDGIDRAAAEARGIVVANTPGAFDDEVADVAMAWTVTLLRRLTAAHDGVKAGRWPKPAGRSARGLRMGIVGLGGIGRALARRAAAAGMETVGCDPDAAAARRRKRPACASFPWRRCWRAATWYRCTARSRPRPAICWMPAAWPP